MNLKIKKLQDAAHREESNRVAVLYPIRWQSVDAQGPTGLCTPPLAVVSPARIGLVHEERDVRSPSPDRNSTRTVRQELLPLASPAERTSAMVGTLRLTKQRQDTPNRDTLKSLTIAQEHISVSWIEKSDSKCLTRNPLPSPPYLELTSPAMSHQQRKHKRHKINCGIGSNW